MRPPKVLLLLAAAGIWLAAAPARAAEGLWTFDDAPTSQVREALGVKLDPAWLDHLRRASVRLTSGCSGSVVSPQGLVLTSEHCVIACAASLSGPDRDFVRDGFLTEARSEERSCPGVQAEILVGIADVTQPVYAAAAGKVGKEYVEATEAALNAAEQRACGGDLRLRCQVMSFFAGGQYKVYKYRTYDDVRLVFAPEFEAAFFGGDVDNFSFPRFDVDFAFLRLWDNGAPAVTPAFLAWSRTPPKEGEAVFLSGNPGATERHLTAAQLKTLRDVVLPTAELQRAELRGRLIEFSETNDEHRRVALQPLFEEENALKILAGRETALRDPAVLAAREKEESDLKARLAVDPPLAASVGDPWAEIAGLQGIYRSEYIVWRQLESGAGGGSELFSYARLLVRAAAERDKPAADRLPEFAPSRLPLAQKILSDSRPVSLDLERLLMEYWLAKTREALGVDSAAVGVLLGKEDPAALAARLTGKTKLADAAFRRALWEGGSAAIAAAHDPLLDYVAATDPLSRAARRLWEEEVIGPSDRAAERIDRVRFAVRQRPLYPEATFSLRLSYGRVAGTGARGPSGGAFTRFGGLYADAAADAPFSLTGRWSAARGRVDPATVLDFVSTNDIIGGASGSPVVDAKGAIVGAAFDGNLASIAGDFLYDEGQNRTISVSTAAIDETLGKVYGRTSLLNELEKP